MATLLELRRRVRSVRNIRQITRAMKMVAAAKLRRAQTRMMSTRPYAEKMWEVLNELAQRSEPHRHPLLSQRRHDRITAMIVTSDRGLCGSFNTNVIRYAQRALGVWRDKSVGLVTVGKVGDGFFRRRPWPIDRSSPDLLADLTFARAAAVARQLMDTFVEGETDAVYVIYNEFKSVLRQNLVVEPLLPIRGISFAPGSDVSARQAARAIAGSQAGLPLDGLGEFGHVATASADAREAEATDTVQAVELVDYLYEPGAREIFDHLLPRHLETQVYQALLESVAAEQAARMTAMENATKNADEMIDTLTLTMNKIRQEEITTEILEVVGGAEALQ